MRYEVAESRYPSYGKHLNPLRHHRICILSSFISSYLFFLRNFFFLVWDFPVVSGVREHRGWPSAYRSLFGKCE